MNTNNVNSPKRRFRSFEGEWEQRKLGNIASMHARIGWQNLRTSEFLDNGDYYLITGTDFLNGRINFEKCHYVNKERYQQDKKIQVGKGSILITKDGTLGKVALVTDLNKPATLNAGVFNVVVKVPSINETYLYQYLAAPFLMDYVSKRATGGTIKHLNQGILVDFPVDIPSYKEQVTIGQFLVCLDNAVTLHQHKLDKLKNLKKAYLSEMFPTEGERVPHRRFPGFEGEWEERKLTEVTEVITKGTTPKDKSWNGPVNYIKTESINSESSKLVRTSSTTLEEHEGYLSRSKLKTGDVLFSIVGTLGRVGIVEEEDLPANTNQQIAIIRLLSPSSEFVMYSLKTTSVKSFIKTDATIGAQPSISLWQIEELKLLFPTITEQEAISSYFKVLDRLITLQQQKLDKLNDLKKAYLNELFV